LRRFGAAGARRSGLGGGLREVEEGLAGEFGDGGIGVAEEGEEGADPGKLARGQTDHGYAARHEG
jgi:hypothetical protein